MKKKVYRNGATLLYEKENGKTTHVSAGFIFGENKDNYSEPTAHFCEHMLFKATKNKDNKTLTSEINNIFSYVNAVTSQVYLRFLFQRANEALEPCFKLASEMLLEPKFDAKDIKNEKGVIKQELIRRNTNFNSQFAFATLSTLRDNHNQNTCTLGSEDEIDAIDSKTLKKFKDEVFISENFVIAIVGGIPFSKAKRLAEKYFINKLPSNPNYPVSKITDFPVNRQGNMLIEHFNFKKTIGRICVKIDKSFEDIKTTEILNMCSWIFNGFNGKLFKLLRDNGLVYEANINRITRRDYHLMNINFESSSENVNKIFDKIAFIIQDLKHNKVEEKMLADVKKNVKLLKIEREKRLLNETGNLIYDYLEFGEKYLTKSNDKKHEKIFNSITSEDVKNFINEAFSKPENIYVTILTGEENPNYYSYKKLQNMLTKYV